MSKDPSINRRTFVKQSSLVAAAGVLQTLSTSTNRLLGSQIGTTQAPAAMPSADKFIAGKDARLIVHSVKTGELETPLALLREHKITPKNLLFVRNNQVLPDALTIKTPPVTDWRIKLSGLIGAEKMISLDELKKLKQQEIELVLQCSGNSRSHFAKSVKAEGAQWQNGAMGNVKFAGIALKDVLAYFKVDVSPNAKYLAAEGKDNPPAGSKGDFEHSIPLADALDRSFLALTMNGEAIPYVHGGPVRLITPGFYATMNVKWLGALRFEEKESSNHHHVDRYRTPLKPMKPGEKFASTLDNSEANWNMRIKSVIFNPLDGAQLTAGRTELRGVAWNDGLTKIETVEISIDEGATWRRASLEQPTSPYAWHHWKISIELPVGQHSIQSRATDARGHSQPLNGSVAWNPAGYAWSGVDSVSINVK